MRLLGHPRKGALENWTFGVCFQVNQGTDSPGTLCKVVTVWFVCVTIKGSVAASMHL